MAEAEPQEKPISIEYIDPPAPEKKPEEKKADTKEGEGGETLEQVKERLAAAEKIAAEEKAKREASDRQLDEARVKLNKTNDDLTKTVNEKFKAQEIAITSKVDAAKAEVANIEAELESAMDAGKSNKEIIALNKKLAKATYALEGAEGAKNQFETWKQNQVKAAEKAAATGGAAQGSEDYTPAAAAWISKHKDQWDNNPRFRRIAEGAHYETIRKGIKADSKEYFDYIESILREDGLLDGEKRAQEPPKKEETKVEEKPKSGVGAANQGAPVSGSGGSTGGNQSSGSLGDRKFRLDSNMRDQARRTYGKGTRFNLSDEEAEQKFAARQLEIQQRRARGERI